MYKIVFSSVIEYFLYGIAPVLSFYLVNCNKSNLRHCKVDELYLFLIIIICGFIIEMLGYKMYKMFSDNLYDYNYKKIIDGQEEEFKNIINSIDNKIEIKLNKEKSIERLYNIAYGFISGESTQELSRNFTYFKLFRSMSASLLVSLVIMLIYYCNNRDILVYLFINLFSLLLSINSFLDYYKRSMTTSIDLIFVENKNSK